MWASYKTGNGMKRNDVERMKYVYLRTYNKLVLFSFCPIYRNVQVCLGSVRGYKYTRMSVLSQLYQTSNNYYIVYVANCSRAREKRSSSILIPILSMHDQFINIDIWHTHIRNTQLYSYPNSCANCSYRQLAY